MYVKTNITQHMLNQNLKLKMRTLVHCLMYETQIHLQNRKYLKLLHLFIQVARMPRLIQHKSVWVGLEWGGMGWCGVEWGAVEWKEVWWGGVGLSG